MEQQTTSGEATLDNSRSFNTFLTIYAIFLAQRFSNNTDLTQIPTPYLRNLTQFLFECTETALEVWEQRSQTLDRSQMLRSKQTRAA